MRTTIETPRLILRAPQLTDAAEISHHISNPAVVRMLGNVPKSNPEIAVEGWIFLRLARKPLNVEFDYVIEKKGGGVIGGVSARARPGGAYEIGYWVGEPFWGRGYATEALRAFTAEASAMGPLFAAHFVDNPASGRVLEKAGFVYTGAVEQRFSLAREARVEARPMRLEAQRAAA